MCHRCLLAEKLKCGIALQTNALAGDRQAHGADLAHRQQCRDADKYGIKGGGLSLFVKEAGAE